MVTLLMTGGAPDHAGDARDGLAAKHSFGAQGNFRLDLPRLENWPLEVPERNDPGRRDVTCHPAIWADDTLGVFR